LGKANELPHHGLPLDTILQDFLALWSAGLVSLHDHRDTMRTFTLEKPEDLLSVVEEDFARPHGVVPEISYGVTPGGGALWEAFVHPRWEHYVLKDFHADGQRGTLTSLSEHFLVAYAKDARQVGFDTLLESMLRVGPWQATHWKTLDSGYRLSFEYREPRTNSKAVLRARSAMAWMHELWRSFPSY
jgi:hypothetical protein